MAIPRRACEPAVGLRLRRLLTVIFALVALIAAGADYRGWFVLLMFLGHLVLGLALVLPVHVFGLTHIRSAQHRPSRRAIRAGYGLFAR